MNKVEALRVLTREIECQIYSTHECEKYDNCVGCPVAYAEDLDAMNKLLIQALGVATYALKDAIKLEDDLK